MKQHIPTVIDVVIPAFNALPLIEKTITALLAQQLPAGYSLTITVVDDGSSDNTENQLRQSFGSRIQIVRLESNQGRSTACNTGAGQGTGELLIFVDSDCIPADDRLIQEHVHALEAGANVSCGRISSDQPGFWSEYQRRLAEKRRDGLVNAYAATSFTTANLLVRRTHFERAGKFNASYRHYGFEDRDLLLRLQKSGSCVDYTPTAIVNHNDVLSLSAVCNKMRLSGQHSSRLFAQQHPDNYRTMAYYHFDARFKPWMRYMAPITSRALPHLVALLEPVLEVRWIPVGLRGMIVKLTSGLAYLEGTCKSEHTL